MRLAKLKLKLAGLMAALGLVLLMQAALAQPQPDGGQSKGEAAKPARAEPDNSARVAQHAKVLHTLKGHEQGVLSVAFTPDGKTLASASYDSLLLWDVTLGKERIRCQGLNGCVSSLACSPDGKTLASATFGGPAPPGPDECAVNLWEVATGKKRTMLKGHRGYVLAEAFSPDGKVLASASMDQTVKLWEVATNKLQATLLGHKHAVNAVAFSPDGKLLASASGDKSTILWDVVTGNKRATLQGHIAIVQSVAFSPDGKTLATASGDKTVKLWEVATGKERATLEGHTDKVTSVTYHPSGNLLASGGQDETIKVWDVTTGKEQAALQGHKEGVYAVAYSRDGSMLASGGNDNSIKLWKIPASKRAEAIDLPSDTLLGLWTTLAGEDAQKAYQASNTLIRASEQTIAVIKKRLRPVAEPNQQEVTRLIADLDSDRFAVRQQAVEALEKLGDRIEQPLRKNLQGKPSLEVQRRIEQVLTAIDQQPLTVEQRQGVRAVEVLERIGTPEAREVVETIARGATGARVTLDAQATLQRMRKHPKGEG